MPIKSLTIIATALPILVYFAVGLRRSSKAKNLSDYFIYSADASPRDYANTSIGYALQVQAIFLFAYWTLVYGLGALWTPIFWGLGFLVLVALLARFELYRKENRQTPETLHEFLASRHSAPRRLRILAAVATILGLGGAMVVEIGYCTQVYYAMSVKEQEWFQASFLIIGAAYIVYNGYKAEVNTERVQVPLAYVCFIAILLCTLPSIWTFAGRHFYSETWYLFLAVAILMIIGKLQVGLRDAVSDPQIWIPILALVGLLVINPWASPVSWLVAGHAHPSGGIAAPLTSQVKAQGVIGLLSLLLANALWMPVDLSTWQRVASVKGSDNDSYDAFKSLKKATLRVMIESPVSWCLGIVLGLIIGGGGFLGAGHDAGSGVTDFAKRLATQSIPGLIPHEGVWLYLVLVMASVAFMLSTINPIISTISFTAYMDLPKGRKSGGARRGTLRGAKLWASLTVVFSFIAFYLLTSKFGAKLPELMYAAFSSQLSLFPAVIFALYQRHCNARAAFTSILGGFLGTVIALGLALSRPENPSLQVLPPIFAVSFACAFYVLSYKKRPEEVRDSPAVAE